MQLLVPLDKIEKTLKYFKKICFVRLKFICKYYIVPIIENENKQMWFASYKEVRRMVEESLLLIIYLLFAGLVSVTIIAVALIIAIAVILSKSK